MDNVFIAILIAFVVVIIAHFGFSRRGVPSEQTKTDTMHWSYRVSLALSVLLLCGYFSVLGYLFYADTVWPHVGSLSIVLFLLMCPGILFQCYFLTYSLKKQKLPDKRILARILSVIFGLVLGSQIPLYAQKIAMDRFTESYQPLVVSIRENLPDPCNPQIPYENQNRLDKLKNMGKLWHDKENFILTFHGRSADVDGSTIYFYSKDGEFKIFHNDSKAHSEDFEKLLTGMEACQQ